MAELKKVREVFSDYKTQSNIQKSDIEKMNLIKKVNALEISMESKEYIEIKEIWYFEKFLRERFQFGQVHMIIQYQEGVRKKSIESEWENLICYMAHKYPLMRPLLLLKSKVEVYFSVDSLDYLQKGGRISGTKAAIGNLLNIKPILKIENGLILQLVLE